MMRLLNRHFKQSVAGCRKLFLSCLHQIEEQANDDDHEASDQVTSRPRRSTSTHTTPQWYGNPILEAMLLDNNEPTSYEEAMVGLDSNEWLDVVKTEIGSMSENKV